MPALHIDPQDDVGESEEHMQMCKTLKRTAVAFPSAAVQFPSTDDSIACDISEIKRLLGDIAIGQGRLESCVLQVSGQLSQPTKCGECVQNESCKRNGGSFELLDFPDESPRIVLPSLRKEDAVKSKRTHTVLPLQKRLMRDASNASLNHSHLACVPTTTPTRLGSFDTQITKSTFESTRKIKYDNVAAACNLRASRNAFADSGQTENDDMELLFQIFERSEEEEAKVQHWRELKKRPCLYSLKAVLSLSPAALEMAIDSLVGVLVVMNCVFIGLAMDYSNDSGPWLGVDTAFSVAFLLELGQKLATHGFRGHFCGSSKYSNCFDAMLVLTDLLQLMLVTLFRNDFAVKDAPAASVFRVVRLSKLSRVLRVLRQPAFNDVLAMLQGMIGGMSTLFWAIVLFLTAVYVVALVFRESFGRKHVEVVSHYFSSVPRSMFTTFRCSFGDCIAMTGVPIFEHVHENYGAVYSLFYCLFIFVITIGLFNVISAIFVESTMNSASQLAVGKKKARLQDEALWCTRVSTLVRRLLVIHANRDPEVRLTDNLEDIYNLDVPCCDIDDLARDPEAIAALNALDIVPEDRDYLSDILDPDNGGTINVIELVEGLRKLRGDPRRSDIVQVNLMVRSLQRNVADIFEALSKLVPEEKRDHDSSTMDRDSSTMPTVVSAMMSNASFVPPRKSAGSLAQTDGG